MNRGGVKLVLISCAVILLVTGFASAGLFDWFGKITGKASTTSTHVLNITLSNAAPTIINITSIDTITLNDGPTTTNSVVNFTVFDNDGASNLNDTSAMANFTYNGEPTRINWSCAKINSGGKYANYTCKLVVYWFDAAGTWNATVFIKDASGSTAMNTTSKFTINALTGFVAGPSALAWDSPAAGAVNQTSTSNPLTMNNTGNQAVGAAGISTNATNLLGEVDSGYGLYASNFSIGPTTGSSAECGETTSTSVNKSIYIAIGVAYLAKGNFTINNGTAGQEQLYFCLRKVGSELSAQSYSTDNQGSWTLKIS